VHWSATWHLQSRETERLLSGARMLASSIPLAISMPLAGSVPIESAFSTAFSGSKPTPMATASAPHKTRKRATIGATIYPKMGRIGDAQKWKMAILSYSKHANVHNEGFTGAARTREYNTLYDNGPIPRTRNRSGDRFNQVQVQVQVQASRALSIGFR
jgi:hypothetical protein